MKKIALVIIAVMMLLSFAGCSSDELGMYNLSKEILKMNSLETTGVIKLSAGGELLNESTDEISKSILSILKSGYEIRYSSKQKMNPVEYEMSFESRAVGETDYKKFTTIIFKDHVMYLKMDDLINALKPYIIKNDPSSEKSLNLAASMMQYVKLDNMDKEAFKAYDNYSELMGFYTDFTDVVPEAFKDFTSASVKKKDNGYVCTINAQDSKKIAINLMSYVLKNADTITGKFKEKINSLSDEDLSVLNMYGKDLTIKKDDMITALDQINEYLKIVNPDYIEKEVAEDKSFNQAFKDLDGSNFEYYIGKNAEGSYNQSLKMKISYQDKLEFNMDCTTDIKSLEGYSVKAPEKAVSAEELSSLASTYLPETVSEVRTNIDSGDTKIKYLNTKKSSDKLNVVVRDGRTYLPLRAVGTLFGEDVGWDEQQRSAYVTRDGKKNYMTGIIVNDRTYIKMKDFEKLGYTVNWDEENREAVVKKGGIDFFSGFGL